MTPDDEGEFTPREIRRNRIQVLLLFVPLLFTVVVIVVRAVT